MKIRWIYIILFALAVCGVVYLSIPNEATLVEMSQDDGNLPRTRELLQQNLERDPGNLKVAMQLADVSHQLGDYVEEAATLRTAYKFHPQDITIRKRLASGLIANDEIDEAMEILPPAQRNPEFLLQAVGYYDKVGDLHKAEEMLLAAQKDSLDKNQLVWLTVADWRADLYNLEGEAEALRKVLQINPENQEAWKRYFINRSWQLDAPETIRAAERLETFGPLDLEHLQTVYNFQLTMQDTAGAIATLDKMSHLPGIDIATKIDYAFLLYRRGAPAKADKLLLELLAAPEGMTRTEEMDAMGFLRGSATGANNMDLALKLASLPASSDLKRANQLAVVEVAVATNRINEAREYFKDLITDPNASVDVVIVGLDLAYHDADYPSMPVLMERLKRAPNPDGSDISVDSVVYGRLDSERPMDFWQAETQLHPQSVSAWAALARVAARQGNAVAVDRAVNAALPLLDDRDFIDSFSLLESLFYLANSESDGSASQRARFDQAFALAERQMKGPLAGSRWFLLMSADLYDRQGKGEVAEALYKRVAAEYPNDLPSMLGVARMVAARGDGATVEKVIQMFEASMATPERTTDEEGGLLTAADRQEQRTDRANDVRSLIYACLAVFDYYHGADNPEPEKYQPWLERAQKLMADYGGQLSGPEIDNVYLKAEVAARAEEWEESYAYWRDAAREVPDNVNAWLGMARAATGMKNPDLAWDALTKAASQDPLGLDVRLQISWQSLEASAAIPEDDPRRAERRAWAEDFAADRLRRQWEPDLAAAVVFRLLDNEDLDRAREFLNQRGWSAPPDVHAALAEAYLAAWLLEQSKSKVKVTEFSENALSEAIAASESKDRSVLMRMAYVLSELNEKKRVEDLLVRIEAIPGEENVENLRQLADAYGYVGNYPRQFELVERRARLGGMEEWLDAIDRHAWAGDYEGGFKLLQEAETLFPDSVELLDRQLAFLDDNNRPGQVIQAFERAAARDPDVESKISADALGALGVSYDDLRSTPRARKFFRLSLEKGPGNKRGSMGAARLLRRDGNLGGAIRILRQYVDGTPDDPWGWLDLANTRSQANQVGRAEYIKVVELTEPDINGEIPTDIRAARGVALRQLGREKEALALLESTVGPIITDPDVACDYAQMLMEIYKYDEAEDILRRTVKAFPYHVWAYRLESTILVRRQKYDLAVARLKEALLWAPDDGEVQRDLGFAAQLWERVWQSQKGWLTAGGR